MKSSVLTAVAILLATLAGSVEAATDDFVWALTIANQTDVPIRYSIKWEDGPWKEMTLKPSEARVLGFRNKIADVFAFRAPAPTAYVRVGGYRSVEYDTYRLKTSAALENDDNTGQGRIYVFRYSHSRTYIDLYETRPHAIRWKK